MGGSGRAGRQQAATTGEGGLKIGAAAAAVGPGGAYQVEQEQAPQARGDGQGHRQPPGEGRGGCGVPSAGWRGGLVSQRAFGAGRLHLDHPHPVPALQIAGAVAQRAVQTGLPGLVPCSHGGRCYPLGRYSMLRRGGGRSAGTLPFQVRVVGRDSVWAPCVTRAGLGGASSAILDVGTAS